MIDAVTIGETMALVRTGNSEKLTNNLPCTLAIGGTESNVAIGLSRLGHRVRWISALGSDAFGDLIAGILESEGVEVVAGRDNQRQTGLMVKSPSKSTERFVNYYRSGSAASNLSPESVSDALIQDARLVHLTGVMPALSESTRRLALEIIQRSKKLNKTISFDVNFRPALWSSSRASLIFQEMATYADIVFGDRTELELLVQEPASSNEELLRQISLLGPSQVILKLAEDGALALIDGEFHAQPAVAVEVVDTVGAGDAFVAGYLSAWLDGSDIAERMFRSTFCGAMACTNLGDWEGAPTRELMEKARGELVK